MVNQTHGKDTVEVRVLPGLMDTGTILSCATFFEALLRWCNEGSVPVPETFDGLLSSLTLAPEVRSFLTNR